MKTTIIATERQSNIELLRIISMSLIVIHHFIVHGLIFKSMQCEPLFYVESITMIGVDTFVMISGWFHIRLSYSSVLKLLITIVFFSVISLLLYRVFTGDNLLSVYYIVSWLLFPFTHSAYWFIAVYFILMIISPILNASIDHLSSRQLLVTVGVMVLVNFWSCSIGGNQVDQNGYNLYNFMCCYMVGAVLNKHHPWICRNIKSFILLVLIIVCAAILCIFIWKCDIVSQYKLDDFISMKAFRYSSPLIFVPAMCMILLFDRLKFSNRIVNRFAGGALGVYLLQDGWARSIQYRLLENMEVWSFSMRVLILVSMFTGLWVVSLICQPILSYLFRILHVKRCSCGHSR